MTMVTMMETTTIKFVSDDGGDSDADVDDNDKNNDHSINITAVTTH